VCRWFFYNFEKRVGGSWPKLVRLSLVIPPTMMLRSSVEPTLDYANNFLYQPLRNAIMASLPAGNPWVPQSVAYRSSLPACEVTKATKECCAGKWDPATVLSDDTRTSAQVSV
jgi:hypothetical protein